MTDTEKKKRAAPELSISAAVARILAIRSELSAAIEKARLDVAERFVGREANILLRVPQEVRALVRSKADAASAEIQSRPLLAEVDAAFNGPPAIPPLEPITFADGPTAHVNERRVTVILPATATDGEAARAVVDKLNETVDDDKLSDDPSADGDTMPPEIPARLRDPLPESRLRIGRK
jgi:hypothetical protein